MPSLSPHPSPTTRAAVLTTAVVNAAGRMGLTGRHLAGILGLSPASASRMKRGDLLLEDGSKPFELAALLVRAFRALDAITGGDEMVARAWLQAFNTALGAKPIDRMLTVQGLVDVSAYLDSRRATL